MGEKEYYDNLVSDAKIKSIREKLGLEDYYNGPEEQVLFLLKNCYYNLNRFLEELGRSKGGFEFPEKPVALKILDNFKVTPGKRWVMGVPITLRAEILQFELHSFIYNIIRCSSMLCYLKLIKCDNFSKEELRDLKISIRGYVTHKKTKKRITVKNKLHDIIITNYNLWVSSINELRDILTHRFLEIDLQGELRFVYRRLSEDDVKMEGNIKLKSQGYDIPNIEEFCNEQIGKLENFVKEFLVEYSKLS